MPDQNLPKIKICTGAACTKNFSKYLIRRAQVEQKKSQNWALETCGCIGNCSRGPTVTLEHGSRMQVHSRVSPVELAKIMSNF